MIREQIGSYCGKTPKLLSEKKEVEAKEDLFQTSQFRGGHFSIQSTIIYTVGCEASAHPFFFVLFCAKRGFLFSLLEKQILEK